MQHRNLDEIEGVVSLRPPQGRLSKRERLERWANLLEGQRSRRLRPLEDVEFVAPRDRWALRANDSPLTVAFEDEVLRADGLESDRLGDALVFFGLSNRQAHEIVCACHYPGRMTAAEVAYRVRWAARPIYDLRLPTVWVSMTGMAVAATAVLTAVML